MSNYLEKTKLKSFKVGHYKKLVLNILVKMITFNNNTNTVTRIENYHQCFCCQKSLVDVLTITR